MKTITIKNYIEAKMLMSDMALFIFKPKTKKMYMSKNYVKLEMNLKITGDKMTVNDKALTNGEIEVLFDDIQSQIDCLDCNQNFAA